ncbi:MAG: TIGR02285 family protein [Desulfobulbaceae bacterium]|nr:MAG: TIGR02285 family protein [Desulfobulbaceae bacterium]
MKKVARFACLNFYLITTLFFLFTVLHSVTSHAQETLTWVFENFPPAFIVEGPQKGNGITDGALDIYIENLPEYEHEKRVANMSRILALIKDGKPVCYPGFIKTKHREEFIEFSLPNILTYSNALIVRRGDENQFLKDHPSISIKKILTEGNLRVGITAGRAYGGSIDSVLENRDDQNGNVFIRSGGDELLGLLKMLKNGRIDCTIGYPWELAYIAREFGLEDDFTVIPIQENHDQRWVLSYIGCPKNDWGRQAIKKLNEVLLTVRPQEEYIQRLLKWYPKEIEQDFRKAYEEHILSVVESRK